MLFSCVEAIIHKIFNLAIFYTCCKNTAIFYGKDTKDGSGRFSALSSCDSPRQDDLDDVDYHFDVDDVDTPVSQPRRIDGKETGDQ
ncbi:hypothetical protein ACJX0J_011506, partial [Zea mays]